MHARAGWCGSPGCSQLPSCVDGPLSRQPLLRGSHGGSPGPCFRSSSCVDCICFVWMCRASIAGSVPEVQCVSFPSASSSSSSRSCRRLGKVWPTPHSDILLTIACMHSCLCAQVPGMPHLLGSRHSTASQSLQGMLPATSIFSPCPCGSCHIVFRAVLVAPSMSRCTANGYVRCLIPCSCRTR